MRSRLALAALLLSLPLAHGGCAARSSGLPNAPIFNTGASATIIPPGAAAPAMPGYGQQRYGLGGPGQASGSYSGSSSGVPGTGGAPGYGASAQSPGYPVAQQPPEMQMLGGATTIDTRQIRRKEDPLWANPLFWPFAVVAWPFVKANRAISAEKDEAFRQRAFQRIQEQTGVPIPDSSPYSGRVQSQMEQERAQQQAIEQQLRQQQAAGGTPGPDGGSGYASAASRPSLSIAEELEALRASADPGATTGAAGAAPVPGAAAADVAEDRSGDGRVDRWVYQSDGHTRELLDEDGDGRPERTVHYQADGKTIARVDEDTDGDGEIDSWSSYQDGVLSRRRADTNGDGEPDTWTLYEGGEVARHEQDSDGDGARDRVDLYEQGRLVRRTEDADGDGRPERITSFDEKGRPSAVEEDTDGDGLVDTRSHFAGGKLVRKELLDDAQMTR